MTKVDHFAPLTLIIDYTASNDQMTNVKQNKHVCLETQTYGCLTLIQLLNKVNLLLHHRPFKITHSDQYH